MITRRALLLEMQGIADEALDALIQPIAVLDMVTILGRALLFIRALQISIGQLLTMEGVEDSKTASAELKPFRQPVSVGIVALAEEIYNRRAAISSDVNYLVGRVLERLQLEGGQSSIVEEALRQNIKFGIAPFKMGRDVLSVIIYLDSEAVSVEGLSEENRTGIRDVAGYCEPEIGNIQGVSLAYRRCHGVPCVALKSEVVSEQTEDPTN